MNFDQGTVTIIENREMAKGFFSLWVHAPEMAQAASPGQFAHIRCAEKSLRRPISICEIDRRAGNLRMVYEIRGEGTLWMSAQPAGGTLDLLAPLGKGFNFRGYRSALFVGGGLGIPPLLGAARAFLGDKEAILGFRCKDIVVLEKDFSSAGCPVTVTTDDGSCGRHGLVTEPLKERLHCGGVDLICTCGPGPMLKAVMAAAEESGIDCQVSLEQHMGCGVGACRVCAVKVRDKDRDTYMHVCLNGPVFETKRFDVQL